MRVEERRVRLLVGLAGEWEGESREGKGTSHEIFHLSIPPTLHRRPFPPRLVPDVNYTIEDEGHYVGIPRRTVLFRVGHLFKLSIQQISSLTSRPTQCSNNITFK